MTEEEEEGEEDGIMIDHAMITETTIEIDRLHVIVRIITDSTDLQEETGIEETIGIEMGALLLCTCRYSLTLRNAA